MSFNRDRVTGLARALSEIATRVVEDRFAISAQEAADVGARITQDVCDGFQSELIYFPFNRRAKADERGRAMLAAFVAADGDIVPVAKQFGVCVQTAYRRVRIAKAETSCTEYVPTLTRDLATIAGRAVRLCLSVPAPAAAEAGLHIAQQLCREHQGQMLYFADAPRQGQLFEPEQLDG